MKIAALFPGQGSQSVGMGKDLFEAYPLAASLFEEADKALGFSLAKLCFDGPIEELTLTYNAQPALLTAGYASYRSAESVLGSALSPSAAAGHSLGEYTALVAAQSVSFADAVALVHKRGKYMQEAVAPGKGAMAAVMGPSPEEIASVLSEVNLGVVEIANLNSPGQTVVAGDVAGVAAFSEAAKAKGAKIIPLNVSAPFHCALMKNAAENLARDLKATTFEAPKFPVYSNVTSEVIASGEQARELLQRQVCSTVRWTESIQNMVSEAGITQVIEFGPGGVLAKLMKRIDKSVKALQIHNPATLTAAKDSLGAE